MRIGWQWFSGVMRSSTHSALLQPFLPGLLDRGRGNEFPLAINPPRQFVSLLGVSFHRILEAPVGFFHGPHPAPAKLAAMANLLCALVLLLSPLAGNREAAELASRMEARYRGAKTLQATFLERYAENGSVVRTEAGTAYFRRPGRMRWEYERPEKDLFLVDGKTAWFYVPADHTVTRVPAKQSADLRTPLAPLAAQIKISRVCSRA